MEIKDVDTSLGLTVKNNKLFNINTQMYEGIDGDKIEFQTNKGVMSGTVVGYTLNQYVNTIEHGPMILEQKYSKDKKVIHNSILK